MTTKDEEEAMRQDFKNLYGLDEIEQSLFKDWIVTFSLLVALLLFFVAIFFWEIFQL